MGALIVLTVLIYAGLAAVELPSLWPRPRRRAFWAVAALLLLGLGLALPVVMGYRPPSVWKGVEAVLKPLGEVLFKPRGG
ncbi:MAG TPA: hypothetical protein VK464_16315 [Symbiobacteriaceae bacterium]|nr:hypothetical protein [Symbiobacteriaceae bacterium]